MKVFLSGGEKGSHRSMLLAAGVKRIAVNLTQLNIPKKKEFSLETLMPGVEVMVYTSEGDEDVARYDEFLRANYDSISIVIGRPDYNGDWLGAKYVPIWSDDKDIERLSWLCQSQGRAAITDKAMTAKSLPHIRSRQQRWGAKLIGITSKTDNIDALEWDAVMVSSWTSSLRYGETQVWDGHSLRRYPAQQKDSARKRHRADIIRLGVDIDAIMEDNVQEAGRLAIKSWQAWETKNVAYDPSGDDDENEFSTAQGGDVVATPTSSVTSGYSDFSPPSIAIEPLQKRHESERMLLPVMGVEQVTSMGTQTTGEQGESIEIDPESIPVIRYHGDPLRQCDNCYLSSRCPAFKEHSDCGFKLPVEIRTKDQLQAALRALLEMQVSRVLFARFAEELEGQGLDPALSKEMDRMFALVEKFRDISDSRELVRMEIETRSSGGVLSRLFGAKAGETARQLSSPVTQNQFDSLALDIIDMEEQ